MTGGFATFDANFCFTYLDPSGERFLGKRLAEVCGRSRWEIEPDIRGTVVEACYRRAMQERVLTSCEYCPPGSDACLSVHVFPTPDGGIAVHFFDITEQKHTEEALRSLTDRYHSILLSSPLPIVALTREGAITLWNPAAERLFGWSAEEVLGGPLPFIPEEKREEHRRMRERDLRGENLKNLEVRRLRKDGSYVDISVSTAPLRGADGTITGIMSLYVDITERKRAEEERQWLLAREQEARNTAESLNRVGSTVLAELDVQKLTERVTDIAKQLTGAEFGAFFPMPQETEMSVSAFDSGQVLLRSDDITQDPRYGEMPPHYALPKGHLALRSYLAAPVISRSGAVLGALLFGHSRAGVFNEQHEQIVAGIAAQSAIALDNARLFAEARQAQEALQQANDELRRANADLEQFAYSASHDLQEPLRMVAIFTQMLKKKYGHKIDESADEYIEYAVKSAGRMQMLVRDLLAYTQARLEPNKTESLIETERVLERTLADLQESVDRNQAVITHGELPRLRMNPTHMQQLLQNLIGNAIKYRSREVPRIHVEAIRQDTDWLFSVRDNGIGIAPQYSKHIFGVFKRLHNREEYEGTGIGLAICQRIVERYGGRIWVESEAGAGSVFFFSIPDQDCTPSR